MIALHQLTAKQSESQRSDLRFHTNHLNSLYQDVQFSVTCRRDGTSTGCFCIFDLTGFSPRRLIFSMLALRRT
jgi:hypothetical protein